MLCRKSSHCLIWIVLTVRTPLIEASSALKHVTWRELYTRWSKLSTNTHMANQQLLFRLLRQSKLVISWLVCTVDTMIKCLIVLFTYVIFIIGYIHVRSSLAHSSTSGWPGIFFTSRLRSIQPQSRRRLIRLDILG